MPQPEIRQYQDTLKELLRRIYREAPIEKEWTAMSGEDLYSPHVDVAGPFLYDRQDKTTPLIMTCDLY